jgi:hypothetical protein
MAWRAGATSSCALGMVPFVSLIIVGVEMISIS